MSTHKIFAVQSVRRARASESNRNPLVNTSLPTARSVERTGTIGIDFVNVGASGRKVISPNAACEKVVKSGALSQSAMMEIGSQVLAAQGVPALQHAGLLMRGGASVVAASALSDAVWKLSGGAGTKGRKNTPNKALVKKSSPSKASVSKSNMVVEERILGLPITPEGKSALYMAIAMACHYLGYSLARPITVALFTSSSTGYAGFPAAFPFAMAFVSPAALSLLVAYGKLLDRSGPRGALTGSTVFCALTVSLAALAIAVFQKHGVMIGSVPAVKFISGPLFVFREAYVQLLTSQYWSFMASVLTPNQSATWFGPIAGLTSIASALSGFAVSPLVNRVGLVGGLCGTGLSLLLSLIGANAAYQMADKYGFTPKDTHKKKKPTRGLAEKEPNVIQKASSLFQRVPVLKALFMEILASQGLATVLNVVFVARLGTAIPDDTERAGWVGVFFAAINVVTMVLQFGILPPLMRVIEPRDLWRAVPIVSLLATGFQMLQKDPSLYVVSASLLVMKVSEYSARRMLDEMVFVPLDFESRFVGKEVIGVFGYRFGKSLMSLGLSGLTSVMGSFGLQELSILSNLVAFTWLSTAWKLSNLVPTREEAETVYLKAHKGDRRRPAKAIKNKKR